MITQPRLLFALGLLATVPGLGRMLVHRQVFPAFGLAVERHQLSVQGVAAHPMRRTQQLGLAGRLGVQ